MTNREESATVPTTSPHEDTARKLYEALLATSTVEKVAGAELPVFRGYITEAFRTTGERQAQYHPAKTLLEYNQCIEIVERAWRGTPGMIVLYGLPLFPLTPVPRNKKDLTATEDYARLEDRVKRLEELVGEIHLPSVLQEIAQRLDGRQ